MTHCFDFNFAESASAEGVAASLAGLDGALAWLDGPGAASVDPRCLQLLGGQLRLRSALVESAWSLAKLAAHRRPLPPVASHAAEPAAAPPPLSEAEARAAAAEEAGLRATLASCLERVQTSAAALELLCPPPSDAPSARVGFDTACSRRLLGGSVPRVITLLSLRAALAAARTHAAQISALLHSSAVPPTFSQLIETLDAFSRGELASTPAAGVAAAPLAPSPAAGPAPGTLARSAALLLLLPSERDLRELVVADAWPPTGGGCGVPPESLAALVTPFSQAPPPPPSPHTAPPQLQLFVASAARAADSLARALCSSRARCRRRLRHTTADWGPLCVEAVALEAPQVSEVEGEAVATPSLSSFWAEEQAGSWAGTATDFSMGGEPSLWQHSWLSSWAIRWASRVQALHLESGLQLELYGTDELGPLCWYLEYLWNGASEALAASETSAAAACAREPLRLARAAAEKATASKARLQEMEKSAEAGRPVPEAAAMRAARAELAATEEAARRAAAICMRHFQQPRPAPSMRASIGQKMMWSGFVRLLVGLEAEGRLPGGGGGDYALGSAFHRYWQRYGTFHNYVHPLPLHYDQWEAHVASALPRDGVPVDGAAPVAPQLYKLATERFKQAVAAFREAGDGAAARCCAANAVGAGLLAGGQHALKVSLDRGWRGWPVLKVSTA